jgi:hypothetical protein
LQGDPARAAEISSRFAVVRARGAAVLVTALAATAAACGDDGERANQLRPPSPINVTAAIDGERIRVSPRRFGAGPVVFVISNQSGDVQRLTFETDELGGDTGGIQRSTGDIQSRSTGTLQVDVREGTYRLSASAGGITPAAVQVGAERDSSQNELLLP